MGGGSGHSNWPIRAEDEEVRHGAMSGSIGKNHFWDQMKAGAGEQMGKTGPFRGPYGGYGQSAWDVVRPRVVRGQ
jgi:hypothetical protein